MTVDAALRDPARLRAVQQVTGAFGAAARQLSRITQLACRLLDVDFGFVSLVDDRLELLVCPAGAGGVRLPGAMSVEASVCRHLVSSAAVLLVPDLHEDAELRQLAEVTALGLRAYAGTPLLSRDGRVVGGLCVGHTLPRTWSRQDAGLLADLASTVEEHLALQVELTALTRRAGSVAARLRVAGLVAAGAPLDAVLDEVGDVAAGLPGAVGSLVLRLHEDGGIERVAGAGTPSVTPAVLAGYADVIDDARSTGRAVSGAVPGSPPCAVVPLSRHGVPWGVVVVLSTDPLPQDALAVLEQLAGLVTTSVAREQELEQWRRAARTDPLTGAANRRAFTEHLAQELARSRRHRYALAVLVLDVDHFKQVNDRYGHELGDRALVEVARTVRRQLRDSDLLARLGGDEFAVILPETDAERAAAVVERVLGSRLETPSAGTALTVSVGIAVTQDGAVPPRDLVAQADSALYEAKAAGRNTARLFGGPGQARGGHRPG